ncbi:MAG TPA: 50S ribosomal protein L4 [Firmicutes bacterium]|nr:50S ribosomal protein L4 [Candidatus Fermentithermobacillaceae bacterium]
MPQAQVFSAKGERVGEMGLSELVFGKEPNKAVIRAAVLAHLAAARQGTVGVKTRAEVAGGGRKPWRQKGLGRARAGRTRSPVWRHGGVAFGPQARDYTHDLPKKVKKAALLSALSSKAQDGRILVIKELSMSAPKTKELWSLLVNLGATKSALIVTAEREPNVVLSARNIPGVQVIEAKDLNTYDTMAKRFIVMTGDAVKKLEEVLS